jgi:hypothetical protein
MIMGFSYRNEAEIVTVATPEHVRDAVCQDPTRCTLAQMGRDAVGFEVYAAIEEETAEVRVTWKADDPDHPGEIRFHRAYLRPQPEAIRLLMATDQNKRRLARRMPPEGIALRIEQHQSRRWQGRTPEMREKELKRRKELARLREQGQGPPPRKQVNRQPVRPPSNTRGLRGVTPA